MKIVADANIAALDESFGHHGEIVRVEGRQIKPNDLANADALLVRSVTPVNSELLDGSSVRFVGTATIGVDHLDINYLARKGTAWASAPGCNADAAAQYTLAMMMLACRRLERDFFGQKVGIVGRGNVGSRLQSLLHALDIPTVACDPPLTDAGKSGLVSMDEALQCPIVTLHVPLTRSGAYPTDRMIDGDALEQLPKQGLLVNAARGQVIDGLELQSWLDSGNGHAALDCWPGEPDFNPALLEAAVVATPHVAGYSAEGKLRGTQMIYAAFCKQFDMEPVKFPQLAGALLEYQAGPPAEVIQRAVLDVSGVERDDAELRSRFGPAGVFDELRRDYPIRREFSSTSVRGISEQCRVALARLGFDS